MAFLFKKTTALALLIFSICGFTSPHAAGLFPFGCSEEAITDTSIHIVIDPAATYQSIHSFGASDCWTAKFIGGWKNEGKKNKIADLLFSTAMQPDGSPKGIGLSMWRVNIGAGSYEQGDSSGIADPYRREECFLGSNGQYDWNKQAGAQWFMKAAKKRGVKYLLGFTNAAPAQFSQDGRTVGLANNNLNLREDKQHAFADFLATVCKHFAAQQLPFDYLSPVNEPQWKWGEHASQEGSGATNAQTAAIIKYIGPALQAAGVRTRITVGEAGQINFLYHAGGQPFDNQIADYFDSGSPNYLGKVPNIANVITYHSYFSTCPDSTLYKTRRELHKKRNETDPKLELWQSEFGVLGDICGQLNGGPRNTGIKYGLYVARVIQADLSVAGASSFQWWLGINPYDYSDGLVYINAPDGSINPAGSVNDGQVSSSKQLWCMGNFSRFVRPGMKRIAATINGSANIGGELLVSAFRNPNSNELVTVIINSSQQPATIALEARARLLQPVIEYYTTSASDNLKYTRVSGSSIEVSSESVTTIISRYR